MALGADKAVVAHESALALLDLSNNIPEQVHLLVLRRHRGLRRPRGVVIHTRGDDQHVETVWRQDLPLTAPARTIVDVLDEPQPEQAAIAVNQALRRGLVTQRQLRDEAARRRKEELVGLLVETAAGR
jgi:predicted transcriptional regulator of viral defense system